MPFLPPEKYLYLFLVHLINSKPNFRSLRTQKKPNKVIWSEINILGKPAEN